MTEALGLSDTCENRRGVLNIPIAVEIAAVPAPHTAVPEQVPNAQAADRKAINRTPEVDIAGIALFIFLPVFGDDLGMSDEVVENTGVQDRNLVLHQFFAKLVALDDLAVFLVRREVELNLGEIEFELTFANNVFLNRPTVLLPRLRHAIAREVDDMLHDLHSAMTTQNRKDLCGLIACTQGFDVCRTISRTTKSHF